MTELSLNNLDKIDGVEANSTNTFQRNEKDSQSEYLLERAKKITTAIYIVTNLVPQTDPLRLSVRKHSIRLLSFVGTKVAGYSPKEIADEIASLCKRMSAMLEIAFFSGYISEMNFSVLKTELDVFTNEISTYEGSQKRIEQGVLKVEKIEDSSLPMSLMGSAAKTGKGQNVTASKVPRMLLPKKAASKPKPQRVPARGLVETKKVSRKESIISIIKLKGTVSIKDISSVIIDCSEKTIQRELIGLVDGGVLKKTGDRRWSTYSLMS